MNTRAAPQLAMRAGFPPGEAKENWGDPAGAVGRKWAQTAVGQLAGLRNALVAASRILGDIDEVPENALVLEPEGTLGSGAFAPAVRDFYLTNPHRAGLGPDGGTVAAGGRAAQPAMAAE